MSKSLTIITWIKEWNEQEKVLSIAPVVDEKGTLNVPAGREHDLIYKIKVREEDKKLFENFISTPTSPKPAVRIEITDPDESVEISWLGLSTLEIKRGIKEVKKWEGSPEFRFEAYKFGDGVVDTNTDYQWKYYSDYLQNKIFYSITPNFASWERAGLSKGLTGDYLVPYGINELLIPSKANWENIEHKEEYIAKINWDKTFYLANYTSGHRTLLVDEDIPIKLNKTGESATNKFGGFRCPADIWDYNALWGFYGMHHEHLSLKEYRKLFNKFQNYSPQNNDLYRTIKSKIIQPDQPFNFGFRAVNDDDWKNRKKETIEDTKSRNVKALDKVSELVELLNQLFASGEPEKNVPKRPQGGDLQQFRDWAIQSLENAIKQEPEKYITDMLSGGYLSDWKREIEKAKDQTEIEIIKERVLERIAWKKKEENYQKKNKDENANELKSSLNNAKTTEDYKIQKEELEKIKNLYGTTEYKNQEAKINELEEKVAGNNTEDYKNLVRNDLVDKMKKWGLEENELTSEIKIKFEKLKEDSISNIKDFIKISHEVIENISLTGAAKQLKILISQAQQLLKGVKEQSQSKANQLIKSLQNFDKVDNVFKQQVYQNERTQIEELVTSLQDSYSPQDTNSNFFRPEVIIPIAFIVVLIAAFLLKLRKRK